MSTDIVIKDRPAFLAPASNAGAMSEFLAGMQTNTVDMPVLSIRGKAFRLRRDGQEVSLKSPVLDVILVGSRPNNSRRFYEGKYVPGELNPPTCASADGVAPDGNATAPQSDTCANCPRNVWGSKITASGTKGKECDDYRRVLVFIPSKQILQPVILEIPATSLRKRKGETGPELQFREYLMAMSRHGMEPYQAVTTLAFTEDEYPRLVFGFARWINAEEHEAVMTCRGSDEFAAALNFAEAPGPIVEAEPAPAPAPKPAAKKAPAKKAEPEPVVEEVELVEDEAPVPVAADELDDILALLD